jgi:NAD(P)-dependent dehydrogenase (short-subunit alcohol dehydrogenase family)
VDLSTPSRPEEIAAVIAFLLKAAAYMTESIVHVDGGRMAT